MKRHQWIGLLVGVLGLLFFAITDAPHHKMSKEAWLTIGAAILMISFWVTEAIPLSITGMFPVAFFPILNIVSIEKISASYAHPLIFMLIGGGLIAMALKKCGIHHRLAVHLLHLSKGNPTKVIFGVMIMATLVSMIVSNIGAATILFPLTLAILNFYETNEHHKHPFYTNFSKVLLLSLAYCATLGGMSTLIGTPPMVYMASYLSENHNILLELGEWMLFSMPFLIVSLPITYLILGKLVFPFQKYGVPQVEHLIEIEKKKLTPLNSTQKIVSGLAIMTVALWASRPFLQNVYPPFSDPAIAIVTVLILFLLPAKNFPGSRMLILEDLHKLPWNIYLLFGGGLALSVAIVETGITLHLEHLLESYHTNHPILLVLACMGLIIVLTEFDSNTATIYATLPIITAVATASGNDILLLAIPATLAASCGFLLPIATPPNALVFSSGKIRLFDMIKGGFLLTIVMVIIIVILVFTIGPIIFGYSF